MPMNPQQQRLALDRVRALLEANGWAVIETRSDGDLPELRARMLEPRTQPAAPRIFAPPTGNRRRPRA